MLSGKDKQWIWKIKLSILFSGPYRGSLGTFWVNSDPGVRISGTHSDQSQLPPGGPFSHTCHWVTHSEKLSLVSSASGQDRSQTANTCLSEESLV